MFDIKEYYNNYEPDELTHDIDDIEHDIKENIDSLLTYQFNKFYKSDRFRYDDHNIDIYYPGLNYQGNPTIIANPDKIRFLLSFYPRKEHLRNIEKIILKPAYVEIGNIELIALYLQKKKVLVFYLYHPHMYKVSNDIFNVDEETAKHIKDLVCSSSVNSNTEGASPYMYIHPLWHILSLINPNKQNNIDKFLIKKDVFNSSIYQLLNDISYFYNKNGY